MEKRKLSSIEVIVEDLKSHPSCAHGPTLLFSRTIDDEGSKRRFFACAACRDRKGCSFFVWADEINTLSTAKKAAWDTEKLKVMPNIDHRKCFIELHKLQQVSPEQRKYCHTCNTFINDLTKHITHDIQNGISDSLLTRPSELLKPLDNNKKEAQYLFSKKSVEVMVSILFQLNLNHVICVGAPRIHEFIQNIRTDRMKTDMSDRSINNLDYSSLLLDIDRRHHMFSGPLQFCWYNLFNHHFFNKDSEGVFKDYLRTNGGNGVCLITDPPFGGRLEPLAETIQTISKLYRALNNITTVLPVMLVMPYFMEPWIKNTMPDMKMCDYKITYENHLQFKDGLLGRKQGSPVRIFTNIPLNKVPLPESEGYRYCEICDRWVSSENKHCYTCNVCASKDGRPYVHCVDCMKCVKRTWKHCQTCKRCCQIGHKCGQLEHNQDCFHCHNPGHKKSECPELVHKEKIKNTKRQKVNPKTVRIENVEQIQVVLKKVTPKVNKKKLRRQRIRLNMKKNIDKNKCIKTGM